MMPTPETLRAFVLAAELGSFSAAARHMGKAQSAISTAIANLEIDTDLMLFDRTTRSPTLTSQGHALLPHAQAILLGTGEFMAKATAMTEDVGGSLCLAIEQGLNMRPVMDLLVRFSEAFPHISLEILTPGLSDTAGLLKKGRADLGLMTEQERYPLGFQFRGVGHTKIVPVCSRHHPLAGMPLVSHRDLRQHRQLMARSRAPEAGVASGDPKSPSIWYGENPVTILELLLQGLGWAELPFPVVNNAIEAGDLVQMKYAFQQNDDLEGIDVVWTEQRALGAAAHWIREALLAVPQAIWRG